MSETIFFLFIRNKPAKLLLALATLFAFVDTGHAHRPYFTQSAKIALPDGKIGEMRLLHGDGIFFTDPVRVIVIDASGRLAGYS